MSAPHEVFVAAPHGRVVMCMETPWDGAVRYIRADLTCGECEYLGKKSFDDIGRPWCNWRQVDTGSLLPACTAFHPKVAP